MPIRRSGTASDWKSRPRWATGLIGGLRARSAVLNASQTHNKGADRVLILSICAAAEASRDYRAPRLTRLAPWLDHAQTSHRMCTLDRPSANGIQRTGRSALVMPDARLIARALSQLTSSRLKKACCTNGP